MAPILDSISETAFLLASESVASKQDVCAMPPFARSSAADFSSVSGFRPFRTTLAPCFAKPSAMAKPSPRLAHVIKAVFPVRSNIKFLTPYAELQFAIR